MRFKGRTQAVKTVQGLLGVARDGQDGPVTWRAIQKALEDKKEKVSSIAQEMVYLAEEEIGTAEVNGTNCGPRVDEYKAATWLDPDKGWPWCAAFICWLVREAIEGEEVDFKRPQTAGAWDFENWAKKQKEGVSLKKPVAKSGGKADIKAGDIVVFTFSHIGLAVGKPDSSGMVPTIEGNTDAAGRREGGAVLRKERHVSKIRSRIRIA
tara:strand:+ start:573 stop:1199 length:627 start_codon:yes stop_codon:yes gene_type:complete